MNSVRPIQAGIAAAVILALAPLLWADGGRVVLPFPVKQPTIAAISLSSPVSLSSALAPGGTRKARRTLPSRYPVVGYASQGFSNGAGHITRPALRKGTAQRATHARRRQIATRLRKNGFEVDWHRHTLAQILDISVRIGLSSELAKRGVAVDWHDYTASELLVMLDAPVSE